MPYTTAHSSLRHWPLRAKVILIRADLNVPFENNAIKDDFRLQALLPTLSYIQQAGGTSVIVTHRGRPTKPDDHLSTHHLVSWFEQHGFTIAFCPHYNPALCKTNHPHAQIILLENSRFCPGEYTQDTAFAAQLSQGIDYYINDAFGAEHRTDTSLTIVPRFFPPDRRSIGFLVERELQSLQKLIHHPRHPMVVIVGGNKIADKLSLLEGLLNIADIILVCPALSSTLAASQGMPVGNSLVDLSSTEQADLLLQKAAASSTTIMLPVDYLIADELWEGPLSYTKAETIPPQGVVIACGPETIKEWLPLIAQAQTLFFNGPMGDITRPETLHALQAILVAIACNETAYRVIGGGDTLAAAHHFGVAHAMNFCSTGGGATLTFLAQKPLPGLIALDA